MITQIQTHSGIYVTIAKPRQQDICIEDIAHALCYLCRFTGHTADMYTVGQHSLLVSYLVPDYLALDGLLHDAPEAYLGDWSTPVKTYIKKHSPEVARLLDLWDTTINRKFNVDVEHPLVKLADAAALTIEKADQMPDSDRPWPITAGHSTKCPDKLHWILRLPAALARIEFLHRYKELTKERTDER